MALNGVTASGKDPNAFPYKQLTILGETCLCHIPALLPLPLLGLGLSC